MACRYLVFDVNMISYDMDVFVHSRPKWIAKFTTTATLCNLHLQDITNFISYGPLLQIFGHLNPPHLAVISAVCKQWRLIMLENEEDLFKKWAVNNGLCKSSFNFKKFGFVSWKHYVQQNIFLLDIMTKLMHVKYGMSFVELCQPMTVMLYCIICL